eukprot:gene10797-10953_t
MSCKGSAGAELPGYYIFAEAEPAYEKDEVRGMERSYLKFSKRLARQPQQCARYSFSGVLLWPRTQLPKVANCAACGGPRVFELQLMPPLIQLTIEAAQMMRDIGQQLELELELELLMMWVVSRQV